MKRILKIQDIYSNHMTTHRLTVLSNKLNSHNTHMKHHAGDQYSKTKHLEHTYVLCVFSMCVLGLSDNANENHKGR